jgi:hypothetical protein
LNRVANFLLPLPFPPFYPGTTYHTRQLSKNGKTVENQHDNPGNLKQEMSKSQGGKFLRTSFFLPAALIRCKPIPILSVFLIKKKER